jgi:hypothetical protein
MNIVTQLILIVLGIGVGFSLIGVQGVLLWRIYRSYSSLVGAFGFLLLGAKQVWSLVQLPSQIIQAQMKGVMIEHLTGTQWFSVIWSYLIMGVFLTYQDWLRRDLRKLGVPYKTEWNDSGGLPSIENVPQPEGACK